MPVLLNSLAYLYADELETHLDEAEQMAKKALEAPLSEGMPRRTRRVCLQEDKCRIPSHGSISRKASWRRRVQAAGGGKAGAKALGLLGNDPVRWRWADPNMGRHRGEARAPARRPAIEV